MVKCARMSGMLAGPTVLEGRVAKALKGEGCSLNGLTGHEQAPGDGPDKMAIQSPWAWEGGADDRRPSGEPVPGGAPGRRMGPVSGMRPVLPWGGGCRDKRRGWSQAQVL